MSPLTLFLTIVTAALAFTALLPASTPQAGGAGASIAAAEAKRLRDALSRVGVMGSEVLKASFTTKHLEQDLGRLLQVSWQGIFCCYKPQALWGMDSSEEAELVKQTHVQALQKVALKSHPKRVCFQNVRYTAQASNGSKNTHLCSQGHGRVLLTPPGILHSCL